MESMMRRAAAPPSHQPLWVCVSKHAHVRTVRPGARRVHGQAVKHLLRAVLCTAPRDRKVSQWSLAASVEFTVVGVGWGKGRLHSPMIGSFFSPGSDCNKFAVAAATGTCGHAHPRWSC